MSKTKIAISLLFTILIGLMLYYYLPYAAFNIFSKSNISLVAPVELRTTDTTKIVVKINGNLFLVPQNYLSLPYTKQSEENKQLFIQVYYPEMLGNSNQLITGNRNKFGWGNKMKISLDGQGKTKDTVAFYKNYTSRIHSRSPYEVYKQYKEYGLIYFKNVSTKKSRVLTNVYIDNLRSPTTYILCDFDPRGADLVYYPTCRQKFKYKDISYTITYSAEYLPEWKKIELATKKLFDNFSKKG